MREYTIDWEIFVELYIRRWAHRRKLNVPNMTIADMCKRHTELNVLVCCLSRVRKRTIYDALEDHGWVACTPAELSSLRHFGVEKFSALKNFRAKIRWGHLASFPVLHHSCCYYTYCKRRQLWWRTRNEAIYLLWLCTSWLSNHTHSISYHRATVWSFLIYRQPKSEVCVQLPALYSVYKINTQ